MKNIQVQTLKEEELESNFEYTKIDVRINPSNETKIFNLLSKNLYKNPIASIVREITANCYDSHTEAGVDRPVRVIINDDEICFIDFGMGLSEDRINNVYSSYMTSTKKSDLNQIGSFGLGSKTPFSYTDNYTIETNCENSYRIYSFVFESNYSTPVLTEIHNEILTEQSESYNQNFTKIIISIKKDDKLNFAKAFQDQIFYDNIEFITDDKITENCVKNHYEIQEFEHFTIVKKKDFFYKDHYERNCIIPEISFGVKVGKVYYPIYQKDELYKYLYQNMEKDTILVPSDKLVLNFEVAQLKISESREYILDENREIVLEKFKLANKEFKENYLNISKKSYFKSFLFDQKVFPKSGYLNELFYHNSYNLPEVLFSARNSSAIEFTNLPNDNNNIPRSLLEIICENLLVGIDYELVFNEYKSIEGSQIYVWPSKYAEFIKSLKNLKSNFNFENFNNFLQCNTYDSTNCQQIINSLFFCSLIYKESKTCNCQELKDIYYNIILYTFNKHKIITFCENIVFGSELVKKPINFLFFRSSLNNLKISKYYIHRDVEKNTSKEYKNEIRKLKERIESFHLVIDSEFFDNYISENRKDIFVNKQVKKARKKSNIKKYEVVLENYCLKSVYNEKDLRFIDIASQYSTKIYEILEENFEDLCTFVNSNSKKEIIIENKSLLVAVQIFNYIINCKLNLRNNSNLDNLINNFNIYFVDFSNTEKNYVQFNKFLNIMISDRGCALNPHFFKMNDGSLPTNQIVKIKNLKNILIQINFSNSDLEEIMQYLNIISEKTEFQKKEDLINIHFKINKVFTAPIQIMKDTKFLEEVISSQVLIYASYLKSQENFKKLFDIQIENFESQIKYFRKKGYGFEFNLEDFLKNAKGNLSKEAIQKVIFGYKKYNNFAIEKGLYHGDKVLSKFSNLKFNNSKGIYEIPLLMDENLENIIYLTNYAISQNKILDQEFVKRFKKILSFFKEIKQEIDRDVPQIDLLKKQLKKGYVLGEIISPDVETRKKLLNILKKNAKLESKSLISILEEKLSVLAQ